MKKVIYIPIIHNKADLGSLGSQLSVEGERKYGVASWQSHLEEVDKSWDEIEIEIARQLENVPWDTIKIYQDGLPVTGEIGIKIVKDAASQGSKNYAIIDALLSQGARLETAEDKELLFQEYYLLSDISKAPTYEQQIEAFLKYQRESLEILNKRDAFIANQINTSLKDGETGIAFFGAAHSVLEKLNNDIDVIAIRMFDDEISRNLINKKGNI